LVALVSRMCEASETISLLMSGDGNVRTVILPGTSYITRLGKGLRQSPQRLELRFVG
jgi:hypothetical protein